MSTLVEAVVRSEVGDAVLGAGQHVGQRVEVSRPVCAHKGAEHYDLRVAVS